MGSAVGALLTSGNRPTGRRPRRSAEAFHGAAERGHRFREGYLSVHRDATENTKAFHRDSGSCGELLATRPNEVWSWDITKLLGPAKWTYFYLYVILDIFSRYVVGWMLAPRESAALAERLIAATCAKQGIEPGSLTVHADRGAACARAALDRDSLGGLDTAISLKLSMLVLTYRGVNAVTGANLWAQLHRGERTSQECAVLMQANRQRMAKSILWLVVLVEQVAHKASSGLAPRRPQS